MHRKRTTADTSTQAARPVRHSDKPSRRYLGIRPVAVLASAAASLLTVGVFAGSIAQMSGAATPHAASTGGSLVGVTPSRLADTRAGSGAQDAGSTLGAGGTINVQVTGHGGVPASGVSAVVLNVTDVNNLAGSALTFVDAYPQGGSVPATANVVAAAGQIVSNLVTVPVGTQGGVTLSNHSGSTDLVVDVDGYYTSTPQATGNYVAVAPTRVLGSTTTTGAAIAAGATTTVTVTGSSTTGIPADATAVVANLTASNGAGVGFLTAYPAGATQPLAANLVYGQGQVIGNRITIPIGTGGAIKIFSNVAVDADLDINGYYTGSVGEVGSTFTALAPTRFVDTRVPTGGSPIAAGATETFSFSGDGIPATATALASNITVVAGSAPGFLTNFPTTESTPPVVADLDWPGSGSIVQNFADAPLNGGATNLFNHGPGSTVNVVLDAFGYFTPVSGVTVLASPSSIPATGTSTSAITISVQSSGQPVSGDPVLIVLTPSTAGSCGALSGQSGTSTNAAGQITATYTSSTTPGSCTITATEALNGLSNSTVITQAGVNNVAVTPANSAVQAGGSETLTATVKKTNNAGAVVVGDTVTWTTSGGASCGTLSPTSGTTAAITGQASTTYTASAVAGFCTVTATESQFNDTGTALVDQTSAPAVSGLAVTLVATPNTLSADGASTSALTGTVKQGAVGIAGDQVLFSSSPSVAGACGTISPTVATTSASGAFSATYTASTTGGTCTITATEADQGASTSAGITQTAHNSITLTANPQAIPANGSTSTLTATVKTPTGGVPAPETVTFAQSPVNANCGAISPLTAQTNATTGVATTTFTSSLNVAFCPITATDTSGGSGTTTIRQSSASGATASSVTVSPSPATVAASGAAHSTVTVTVDSAGNVPVLGDPVVLSTTPSVAGACGGLSPSSGTTNASGQVTSTYTSTTTAGTCTITATEGNSGLSGTGMITQSGFNTVALNPASGTVAANGSTDVLTATVHDSGNNLLPGDTVAFTTSGGASCGTVSPTSAVTNANGVATTTYTASAAAGFCTVTATEGQFGNSSQTILDQTSFPAVFTAAVSIAPASANILANGTATQAITGTVTANATGVPGDQVRFTLTPSVAGACGAVSPAIATTAADGTYSTTYTASTTAGTCTIVATEADSAQHSSNSVLTQTATHSLAVSPTSFFIAHGGVAQQVITVTVTNGAGAPVSGDTLGAVVTGGAQCGGVTSPAATNANGVTTVTYTAGASAGFCTITFNDTAVSPTVSATSQADQT